MSWVTGASGLPNSVRIAAANALTGFHAAMYCSQVGIVAIGTNALLMNVSGNTTVKPMPITASGERTISPSHVPTQIIAAAKQTISRSAITTSAGPVCTRQPTA